MAGKMPGRRENFGRGSRGRGGNMYKPSPYRKEKNSSPKKIKTEQLQQAGYLVSPESKQSKFPIKKVIEILKTQDNSHFQERELREMLTSWRKFKRKRVNDIQSMNYATIVEELQQAQKQLLLQDDCDFAYDEVVAMLSDKSVQQLNESMEIEQLREMLNVWNNQHQIDNSSIKQLKNTEIVSRLTKAKNSLLENDFSGKNESMIEELDRETDHIFETVGKMQINGKTTDDQIIDFNDEELAYFQYVKSLREDNHLSLDDLKELHRSELVEYCKKWRDSEHTKQNASVVEMLMDSEDEDELYDQPKSNVESITQSIKETDIEVSPPDIAIENENNIDSSQNIDLNTIKTIQQFRNLDELNKCKCIHNLSIKRGEDIHLDTIKLWPNDQIDKIAQNFFKPASQPEQTSTTKSSLKKISKYASKPIVQQNLYNQVMTPWRYSLFITTPLTNKSVEGLTQYLSDIFHEMGSFCQGIQLLPWDTDDLENSIEDCEEIPKTISQLKKYFKGARSPAGNVTKQYLKIRLGYPIQADRPTFEADIMEWCKEREIRMFECPLQLSDTKVIGWLTYMPNTVDRDKWCRATRELYQMVDKSRQSDEIQIGVAWKALSGQWDIQQKQKVYAFHVETSIDQAARIKKFLRLVAHNKKYPLGVRFRLCDEFTQYMKESSRIKYNYMRDKHKTLCKEMRQVETDTIINLDRKVGDTKLTLRDIILNIRDNTDERRIFNSIDQKYNNPSAYVIQYRPDKAELAKAYTQSLSTYVKHLYPKASLTKIFTISAIEEANIETYYPNTQTFITQEDMDFDAVIQEDLDDDSFEYLNVNNINPFEIELPEKLKGGEKLYNFNGDDDTASTMPANSSTISFSNASVHLYDTKSLVSEISSLSDRKKQTKYQIAEPIQTDKEEHKMDEATEA